MTKYFAHKCQNIFH